MAAALLVAVRCTAARVICIISRRARARSGLLESRSATSSLLLLPSGVAAAKTVQSLLALALLTQATKFICMGSAVMSTIRR